MLVVSIGFYCVCEVFVIMLLFMYGLGINRWMCMLCFIVWCSVLRVSLFGMK